MTSMCGSHCLVLKTEAGSVNEMFVSLRKLKCQKKKYPMTPPKKAAIYFSLDEDILNENTVYTDCPVTMFDEILIET